MKSLFLSIALFSALIGNQFTFGQNTEGVSISSGLVPPDPSAILDVSASDKGVLLPRVSLTSITDVVSVPSPVISLLLYNTNENIIGGCGKGFYSWNGSMWEKLGCGCIPQMTFAQMVALTSSLGASDINFQVYVTDVSVNIELVRFNTNCSGQSVNVQGIWEFKNNNCWPCKNGIEWRKVGGFTNDPCADNTNCTC